VALAQPLMGHEGHIHPWRNRLQPLGRPGRWGLTWFDLRNNRGQMGAGSKPWGTLNC
jgi:hypothetical protein